MYMAAITASQHPGADQRLDLAAPYPDL